MWRKGEIRGSGTREETSVGVGKCSYQLKSKPRYQVPG